MKKFRACCQIGLLALSLSFAHAQESLSGDVGMALYRTPPITHTTDRANTVLPYLYADFGRLYARVDTFGIKTARLGQGFLELAGRVSLEGYAPTQSSVETRRSPVPLGLGTLQVTPYGAFFVYGLVDARSKGVLFDANYAAEFSWGPVTFYPQIGIERRSARYVQNLYGVSSAQAQASGLTAYDAGASITPSLALAAQYPLGKAFNVTVQVRKRWLDKSITDSPLVTASSQTTALVALTRHFD